MMLNVPNLLTLIRIALIPVFIVAFYLPFSWASQLTAFIFALAAVTDWFDGYLARRLGQTSAFGAFLDPVADKLMVAVALVLLVDQNPTPFAGFLMAIPAVIIIGREITISALREWMAEIGERASVAVSVIGKIKTMAQMLALVLLLYKDPIGDFSTALVGFIFLYIAVALTVWSMLIYIKAAWPILMKAK